MSTSSPNIKRSLITKGAVRPRGVTQGSPLNQTGSSLESASSPLLQDRRPHTTGYTPQLLIQPTPRSPRRTSTHGTHGSSPSFHRMEVIESPRNVCLPSKRGDGGCSPTCSTPDSPIEDDASVFSPDPDSVRVGTVVKNSSQPPVTPPVALHPPPVISLTSPASMMSPPSINYKELLGRGSFGTVYKAMNRETNQIFVIKEILLVKDNPSQIAQVSKEISVMKKLDHRNVVRYYGARREGGRLLIHMEFVDGGSVSRVLREFGSLSERQTQLYTQQIMEGLTYLHEKKVVHRDLKGENLLVDKNGCLKLADFGTAKELDTIASKTVAGTSHFMAPEVIRGTGHDCAADIWSVGCCVVEMLTGKPPFSQFETPYAAMTFICEHPTPCDIIPGGVSAACRDFLMKCIQRNPEDRPTARQLFQHPWLAAPGPLPPLSSGPPQTPHSLEAFNPVNE